nr:hypothetical protein [Tanacetum cinerariifolium]
PIPVEDSDSQMEEIDLFLATDELMPPGIENDDYDSEGDIHFLEELLSNDTLPIPKNDSSNFDHHDDLSFPRPPPKPSDVEIFFDFEPNTGVLTAKVNFKVIHKKSFISLNNTPQISPVNVILPVLPTEEPDNSLSIGDEHLGTILETELDKVIKSSVENLVPILSEFEDFSDNESECDVPVCDDFKNFFNPLFDSDDDFSSSDDKSLSNEDVPMIYSNSLFDDEEIIPTKKDPHYFNAESNLIESLSNRDTLFDSFPKFDYLEEFSGELMPTSVINEELIKREHEEYISLMVKLLPINSFPRPLENFHANTIIETLPTSPIPVEDSDSLREEIDIFTGTNDFMPPGIESDDYDSEGDIHFLEELLRNDSISLLKNESSTFDHHDDPSFPRPLSKPPDVEIFFEPDSGVLTTNVVKGISEHYVLMPNILPTLTTFDPIYPVYDTLLLLSSENEDKVFKLGILSYLLVSHQAKTTSNFSENPMMMYRGDIPSKVVSDLHTISMDK